MESINPANVDSPVTFTLAKVDTPETSKLLLISTRSLKVAISATLRTSKLVTPSTSREPLASIVPVNVDKPVTLTLAIVETPDILTSSSSDTPSTFIVLLNVAASETLRTSKSVCPSTSKLALASILPANVLTPATLRSSSSL